MPPHEPVAAPLKRLDLVYFNAGGGHRAAAQALQAVIAEQRRGWQVRLVDLFERLDPEGAFRRYTGFAPEDYYNRRLARGWTLGLAQELKLLQGMIRLGHRQIVRTLQQHWLASESDLVVSLVPNFNRALCESLASALPGVPFVTVLTDLADHPPNFWIEPGLPQHVVCGTRRAVEQALATGLPPRQVHASSGMILRPDFYRPPPADRDAARRALGLPAERPTGLVLFGGHGAKAMLGIAERLPDTPLILLCGHNRALADKLRALPAKAPRVVVGFTAEIPRYMRLADFFIGKPGPGSLSEALHLGLPVIVTHNAWTMPQERYNTQWVREQGVGLVLGSFRGIAAAVDELVGGLGEFRQRIAGLPENRAVFEIPELLERLLAEAELAPELRAGVAVTPP